MIGRRFAMGDGWISWAQPIFTNSNTASDGSITSASSYYADCYPYLAMNGITTDAWFPNNQTTGWWQVIFPQPIKITNLIHYNRSSETVEQRGVTGRFYTNSTMVTPIGDSINTPNINAYETIITGIPVTGIITDTIFFKKSDDNGYSGIGELKITAIYKP